MNQEEYRSTGLVRKTNAPESAKSGAPAKKARFTGASLDGLRSNIKKGKLISKIEKYNREYEQLLKVADDVNEARKDGDIDGDYSAAVARINDYNRQAKRLAKLGVQILSQDRNIMKAIFAKEAKAKGLKVPKFLLGPMKLLSDVGREQSKLLKEAKIEKKRVEGQIFRHIVSNAQNIVGKEPTDTVTDDKEKIEAIKFNNLEKTVINALNGQESQPAKTEENDSKNEKITEEQNSKIEEALKQKKEEQAKLEEALKHKKEEELAKINDNSKRKAEEDQAKLEEALKRRKEAEKNNTSDSRKNNSTISDIFESLGVIANKYTIGLDYLDDKFTKALKFREKGQFLSVDDLTKNLKIDANDAKKVYDDLINLVSLSSSYIYAFNGDSDISKDKIKSYFSDEKNKLAFNFIVDYVKSGKYAESKENEKEKIVAEAEKSLNKEEADIVNKILNYCSEKNIKDAIEAYDDINNILKAHGYSESDIKNTLYSATDVDKEVENTNDNPVNSASNKESIDEALQNLVNRKYGKENSEPIIKPDKTEEEQKNVKEETKEEINSDNDKVQTSDYVSEIAKLTHNIAQLTKSKEVLINSLGENEAKAQVEAIEKNILSIKSKIDKLALENISLLEKDEKKPIELVTETKDAKEEATPVPESDSKDEKASEETIEPVTETEDAKEELTLVSESDSKDEEASKSDEERYNLELAKKWEELMSDPDLTNSYLENKGFSDEEIRAMNRNAKDSFYQEEREKSTALHEEMTNKIRENVAERRREKVNEARVSTISELFSLDPESLKEISKSEDGQKQLMNIVNNQKEINPNGYAWSINTFAEKLASTGDRDSSEFKNIIERLLNDQETSYTDAAALINAKNKSESTDNTKIM